MVAEGISSVGISEKKMRPEVNPDPAKTTALRYFSSVVIKTNVL